MAVLRSPPVSRGSTNLTTSRSRHVPNHSPITPSLPLVSHPLFLFHNLSILYSNPSLIYVPLHTSITHLNIYPLPHFHSSVLSFPVLHLSVKQSPISSSVVVLHSLPFFVPFPRFPPLPLLFPSVPFPPKAAVHVRQVSPHSLFWVSSYKPSVLLLVL